MFNQGPPNVATKLLADLENHANKLALDAMHIKKGKGNYELNLSAIKGSLTEKQTDHMLESQLIAKQSMSNLFPHASSEIKPEIISRFFDEIVTDRYKGKVLWNEKLKLALEKPVKELSVTEQEAFIKNIDNIGLSDIIDALKSEDLQGYATDVIRDEFGDINNSKLVEESMDPNMNIIITPHIAGMTKEAQEIAYHWAIDKLENKYYD